MVRILLEAGADPHAAPIIMEPSHKEIIQMLLKAGAYIDYIHYEKNIRFLPHIEKEEKLQHFITSA